MKALIVKAVDNSYEVVEFTNETSYKVLSGAVGGYIECVRLDKDLDLWLNEEGKLNSENIANDFGTEAWRRAYGPTDVVMGDIILTGGTDDEGNTLGLSDTQVAMLVAIIEMGVPHVSPERTARVLAAFR